MSAPLPAVDAERLLTFEVRSGVYALPIAEVHEVAEAQRVCCVPTITRESVGVVNWHGDALPVVSAPLLLEAVEPPEPGEAPEEEEAAEEAAREATPEEGPGPLLRSQHLLVLSARDDEPALLGMPIDRVIGLVDGPRRRRGAGRMVVERRSVEGRVVSVLDPRRLVERATEVIARFA